MTGGKLRKGRRRREEGKAVVGENVVRKAKGESRVRSWWWTPLESAMRINFSALFCGLYNQKRQGFVASSVITMVRLLKKSVRR